MAPANDGSRSSVKTTGKPSQLGRKRPMNPGCTRIHHPWCVTQHKAHSYDGRTTPRTAPTRPVRQV
ncbi:hypothetical protein GCM10010393_17290 [Streptomyces gobitricini]|uniref:Uncharacterized protein n=1 Tax=Streptomyces gobitricini TaxID=68211 RepID=A0ABN3LM98_9ACTN